MKKYALWTAVSLAVAIAVALIAYELFENPSNQMFGTTVNHGPTNVRAVALTYDDGPNPPYTSQILSTLEREHVPATFFVVGRAVQAYPAIVRREVRDGDAVENHTWDHRHLIVMPRAAVRQSIQRTDAAVFAAAHVHTRLLRPPFGARDWIVMQEARKLGYTVVLWSVPLAKDWESPPAKVIAQRLLRRVSDGSILVLHDGNRGLVCAKDRLKPHTCDRSDTVQATAIIIASLRRQGYRFVTVPELIKRTSVHQIE